MEYIFVSLNILPKLIEESMTNKPRRFMSLLVYLLVTLSKILRVDKKQSGRVSEKDLSALR